MNYCNIYIEIYLASQYLVDFKFSAKQHEFDLGFDFYPLIHTFIGAHLAMYPIGRGISTTKGNLIRLYPKAPNVIGLQFTAKGTKCNVFTFKCHSNQMKCINYSLQPKATNVMHLQLTSKGTKYNRFTVYSQRYRM